MLPREKFLKWGLSNLSLKDLISIIVASGNRKRNVFQISQEVEKLFKRGHVNFKDFLKIEGLGEVKAMKLSVCIELGLRYYSDKVSRRVIKTSEEAYETLRGMGRYRQEHFVCIFLNARYEEVFRKTVGIGTVDGVHVLPRDIIIAGLKFNSLYVIMAHNHPSGNLQASQGDVDVTRRIKQSLELVGMELLDHLIISNNGWSRVEII